MNFQPINLIAKNKKKQHIHKLSLNEQIRALTRAAVKCRIASVVMGHRGHVSHFIERSFGE